MKNPKAVALGSEVGGGVIGAYDYVDSAVPMLFRMFKKRLSTYRAIGYARGEAPLGLAEPPEEHTIEYHEEALRHFDENV